MNKVLVTGGSGFFGEILIRALIEQGYFCVNIDLVKCEIQSGNLVSYQGDIRNTELLETIFEKHQFCAIYHCAAILAHGHNSKDFLWSSNVTGTQNVVEFAKKYSVKHLVFLSSNCLWGTGFDKPVDENVTPAPIEIYGKSKLEAEKILMNYKDYVNSVIIRCPTIMDYGRLGLLTLLFDFIREGKKVWVVGNGKNRYQFIYAKDLVSACIKAANYDKTDVFHIGSDNVRSFEEVYNYVIEKANTKARVAHLPRKLSIFGMRLSYKLGISPLGPYQYKMLSESFIFDTAKIKKYLDWEPTVTNDEMLYRAYKYYNDNYDLIHSRKDVSAHRSAAKMGIIRVLKWIS